jgi:hypothetical protein
VPSLSALRSLSVFRPRPSACRLPPGVLLVGLLALPLALGSEKPSAKPQIPAPHDGAARPSRRDARLDLIRGLMSEVAVAKIAMPRGKHGVYLNAQGQLDQARADAELRQNGAAIRPGLPVEITKVEFKGDRIVFEINHGGKSGKKWYQHIEIGMGTATQPIAPDNGAPILAYGSFVSLKVPGNLADLTVPRVKQLLGAALDFERHAPTVLYSASVPPKIKAAIQKHEVLVGMDRDAVLSAKGPPDRKVREVHDGAEQEDWIYGLPPHVLFVTFDGDTVNAVRQY